ncbi:hypothetical protein E2C01_053988 [Portunus trituberculatus]|uniref:Uncharacterized protein n=1 Tax=Portunus trituberculatus TaxID=210409 RepID=A0A5B7GRJ2_PORTR|nr:hypothetical protein [Portunus trituberculatus]
MYPAFLLYFLRRRVATTEPAAKDALLAGLPQPGREEGGAPHLKGEDEGKDRKEQTEKEEKK